VHAANIEHRIGPGTPAHSNHTYSGSPSGPRSGSLVATDPEGPAALNSLNTPRGRYHSLATEHRRFGYLYLFQRVSAAARHVNVSSPPEIGPLSWTRAPRPRRPQGCRFDG
jgi:hypothetical protein